MMSMRLQDIQEARHIGYSKAVAKILQTLNTHLSGRAEIEIKVDEQPKVVVAGLTAALGPPTETEEETDNHYATASWSVNNKHLLYIYGDWFDGPDNLPDENTVFIDVKGINKNTLIW